MRQTVSHRGYRPAVGSFALALKEETKDWSCFCYRRNGVVVVAVVVVAVVVAAAAAAAVVVRFV